MDQTVSRLHAQARLLSCLETGPTPVRALANQTGLSPAAVGDHLDALHAEGFEFCETAAGYRVTACPAYGGGAIAYGLDAPVAVAYYDRVVSTNDRARELAAADRAATATAAADIAVVADAQTGGRGRRDRAWASPPGGVWLSVLFRPDAPATQAPLYQLAGAVAAARAVPVEARIKWPNDVLLDGQKLAGVLTEAETAGGSVESVIIGIGINANVDPDALPGDHPTSLAAETGSADRRQIAQTTIETAHELVANPGRILPMWRSLAGTLGQMVRVETTVGTVIGRAVDVTAPGALVIDTGNGRQTVTAGQCEHLRPAADESV